MNSKTLLGFVAGVAVALGLSFVISHRTGNGTAARQPAAVVAEANSAPSDAPEAPESQIVPSKPEAEPKPVEASKVPARTSVASIVQPRSAKAPVSISHAAPVPPPAPAASAPPPPPPVTAAPAAAAAVAAEPVPPPAPAVTRPIEARVFRPEPPAPSRAPAREPSTVTIKEGTTFSIRLGEGLSSDRNRSGDEFTGTLEQPLVVDDLVIAERGARVEGRVVESQVAGRVKGLAHLSIELTRLHTADGQNVAIRTDSYAQDGPTSKKEDAAKVGAGAAIGAIIGAIAGGGKGAAIGAGVGGAAGGGTVAATRGKPVVLPVETHVTFRLEQPVTITEQLRN